MSRSPFQVFFFPQSLLETSRFPIQGILICVAQNALFSEIGTWHSQIIDRRNKYVLIEIHSACDMQDSYIIVKLTKRLVLLAVHFVPLSHIAGVPTVEQVQIIIQFYKLNTSP